MKFSIPISKMNDLIDYAKVFIDRKTPWKDSIQVHFIDDLLSFSICGGFSIIKVNFKNYEDVSDYSAITGQNITIRLPDKKFKASLELISVESTEKGTIYTTSDESIIIPYQDFQEKFPNRKTINNLIELDMSTENDPVLINAKFLSSILNVMSKANAKHVVKIENLGKLQGFLITNDEAKCRILPNNYKDIFPPVL